MASNQEDIEKAEDFLISTAEAMNPRRRSTMEDCHTILRPGGWDTPIPNLTFMGLYDGHGGRDMVEFAQHALPFHIAQELTSMEGDGDARRKSILRAVLMADIHARQVGITSSGAAVALCLVELDPAVPGQARLLAANVGDARIVLGMETKRQSTRLFYTERLTVDHKSDEASEVQRIEQNGGFCFKRRVLGVLALSRAMGDQCLKDMVLGEPYIREIVLELDKEDSTRKTFIILACDGLWDVMTDHEATMRVASWEGDPEKVADDLVAEALRRGTSDNLTVVVAWLQTAGSSTEK